MVRAILEGRKTQTRRIVRFPKHAHQPDTKWIESVNPDGAGGWIAWGPHGVTDEFSMRAYPTGGGFRCHYGVPGDLLWVRETFAVQPFLWERNHDLQPVHYPATVQREEIEDYVYKPSIHMPRWASRITLEVTGVHVEQLQDITGDDVLAEGIEFPNGNDFTAAAIDARWAPFRSTWNSIYAKRGYGWKTNPWVWVVEFSLVMA